MTDPERWRTSQDAPAEIRALLRAARDEAPGPEITTRLDARLTFAKVPPATPVALPGWIVPSGLVVALAVGLGVAGRFWSARAETVSVGHPKYESSSPSDATAPSAPEVTSDAPEPVHAELPSQKAKAVPSTVPSELELIREARRALTSAPAESLRSLDQHRRLHAGGKLAQEREVLAVRALTRLGRVEEAEARARAFSARHPSSAHKARVERETSTKSSESEIPASTHPK